MELTDRKITSLNVEETQRIAAALAEVVVPGTVIALEGDLGAGKTHFTQGLARGLGVGEAVTSPTFNVMSVYAWKMRSSLKISHSMTMSKPMG